MYLLLGHSILLCGFIASWLEMAWVHSCEHSCVIDNSAGSLKYLETLWLTLCSSEFIYHCNNCMQLLAQLGNCTAYCILHTVQFHNFQWDKDASCHPTASCTWSYMNNCLLVVRHFALSWKKTSVYMLPPGSLSWRFLDESLVEAYVGLVCTLAWNCSCVTEFW